MAGACLFLIYISSIAVGVELKCHADVVGKQWVMWFLDLTCVFWAKNARKNWGENKGNQISGFTFGICARIRGRIDSSIPTIANCAMVGGARAFATS